MEFIITQERITVMFKHLNTGVVTLTAYDKNYGKITAFLVRNEGLDTPEKEAELLDLLNPVKKSLRVLATAGDIEVGAVDGTFNVCYKGMEIPMSDKIKEVIELAVHSYEKGDSKHLKTLLNFLDKCYKNPIPSVINQIADFVDAAGLTMDVDGDIYAYKVVNNDYKDIYSKTMDNSPGTIVEMPRFKVETDPHKTCAAGLHFAAWDYLHCYANIENSKVLLLKINPADIVSIPSDYGNKKGRACKYLVVREVEKPKELEMVAFMDAGEDAEYYEEEEEDTFRDGLDDNYWPGL